ncbi:MAG: hypothetical protein Q7S71_05140 [Candidatus Nitrotoga sp.]|nr:hypothetical protein [Candidatus Nitrotoga sp.]
MDKHWIDSALEYLTQSLEPIPHEINEIDWKASLSPEKNRLTEHLIASIHLPKTTRRPKITGVAAPSVASNISFIPGLCHRLGGARMESWASKVE